MKQYGNQNKKAKYSFFQKQPSRGVLRKVFWKYAANLQDSSHTEVWFP